MYKYDETRNLIDEGYVDPTYVSPHCVVQVVEVLDKMRKHSIETYYHLIDVANLTKMIFEHEDLGLTEKEKGELYTAALLHDLGKLAVPADILHSKFDENSADKIRDYIKIPHMIEGIKMIRSIVDDPVISYYVELHHEKLNGKGYPRGLKGEQINEGARILAVADITSAVMMPRSYRPDKMDLESTSKILNEMAFKGEIDARIVEIMIQQLSIYNPTDEFVK